MALLTASALVTVTHVSVLLSLHRCMWLSQMFLGLTALAVCSKAEPFKQLLCQLDFEPGEKDLQSTALQPRGVGAELGPRFAVTAGVIQKQGLVQIHLEVASVMRFTVLTVTGERLLLALLYPHYRDEKV